MTGMCLQESESKQNHLVGVVCTDAVTSAIALIMQSTVFLFVCLFVFTSVHMTEKRSTIDPEHKSSNCLVRLPQRTNRWRSHHVTSIFFFYAFLKICLMLEMLVILIIWAERCEKTLSRNQSIETQGWRFT